MRPVGVGQQKMEILMKTGGVMLVMIVLVLRILELKKMLF